MLRHLSLRAGLARLPVLALASLGPLALDPAHALNMPVASRVIAFVQPPLSGVVTAAIIFEPGNVASEAEAAAIEQEVGNGIAIGRGIIRVRKVPVGTLGSVPGIRLAFVTAGIHDQQQLSNFAARDGVLTITSDATCVQAARCVLSVSDNARIQITVSRAAAQASRIHFQSAFLMLVKER